MAGKIAKVTKTPFERVGKSRSHPATLALNKGGEMTEDGAYGAQGKSLNPEHEQTACSVQCITCMIASTAVDQQQKYLCAD